MSGLARCFPHCKLALLNRPLCHSPPTQHDAQLDYYGKRLATASSDRTIRVFDVSGAQQQLVAELKGCALGTSVFYLTCFHAQFWLRHAPGTRVPYGKSHGATPSTAACSPRAHTTARSSFGTRFSRHPFSCAISTSPSVMARFRKEEENGTWVKLFDNALHESSGSLHHSLSILSSSSRFVCLFA